MKKKDHFDSLLPNPCPSCGWKPQMRHANVIRLSNFLLPFYVLFSGVDYAESKKAKSRGAFFGLCNRFNVMQLQAVSRSKCRTFKSSANVLPPTMPCETCQQHWRGWPFRKGLAASADKFPDIPIIVPKKGAARICGLCQKRGVFVKLVKVFWICPSTACIC